MANKLTIAPLEAEVFAPFGHVIEAPKKDPDLGSYDNTYWDAVVPFRVTSPPQLGFLEVYWRPFVVHTVEKHLTHTQAFIPLGGAPFVQVVGAPGIDPVMGPEVLRAFFLDGTKGVVLHEGTWHALLFPLGPVARAVLLLQEGTKERDMHVVTLPQPIRIEFRDTAGREDAARYR